MKWVYLQFLKYLNKILFLLQSPVNIYTIIDLPSNAHAQRQVPTEQQTINSPHRDNNSFYESPIDLRPVVDEDTDSDNTTPSSPKDGPTNNKYQLFSNAPSEMGSIKSVEEEQEQEKVAVKAEEGRKEEADEIFRECEANYNAMEKDGTLRRLNRMSRHHNFNEMGESFDKSDQQQ